MHELRIAQAVIDIVESEITRRRLKKITAVGVRVGALSGVHPDALSFSFEAATMETPLAGAKLVLEYLPAKAKCRTCGRPFEVEEFVFLCSSCGSGDVEVTQGEELDVVYLVGE
jgi:hydrogenase nickel incorporation protein HypA/HybF